MGKIKVSVCVITYNHGKYIEDCLKSLVTQETNFDFEILVSDDCSTDGTAAIVQKYADLYPDKITAFLHKTNMGGCENYLFVHRKAVGEYIAVMDGDDYALPGKLQVQSDFLDQHPECNILWHRVMAELGHNGPMVEDQINVANFPATGIDRHLIMTLVTVGANSSKMYRTVKRDVPLAEFEFVDYFLNIEQVGDGKAYFVNDKIYGVYRVGVGTSSRSNHTKVLLCKTFEYFARKYPDGRKYLNAACLLLLIVDLKNFRKSSLMYIKTFIKTFHISSFYILVKYWNIRKMLRFN
jgi:glycosyltransferase involved in cell wall biosynthesis